MALLKRSERLKALYLWTELKSVRAFAREVNVPQKTMDSYIKSQTEPREEVLLKVLKSYPDVSKEWLINGEGGMFGPLPVKVENSPNTNVANGDNNNQSVTTGDGKLVEELTKSRSSIVKQVLRKIAKALECPTKEEADEHLKELEETLNDMNL